MTTTKSKTSTRERGIIFSAPMVRELIAGRKTATRRLLQKQPFESGHRPGEWMQWCGHSTANTNRRRRDVYDKSGKLLESDEYMIPVSEWLLERCPFKIGDTLWVKETWCPRSNGLLMMEKIQRPFYRADGDEAPRNHKPEGWKWKSSMFMPRWASRINLRIMSLKVERVNEITEKEARAEGRGSVAAFAELWDKLHGNGAFNLGDWVWVIGFEVLK